MKKAGILLIFVLVNAALLVLALNPWITTWQGQAQMVLIIEVIFLVIVGLPVLLYQMIVRKKTFRQSLSDSLDTVLDFLSGFG